MLLFQAYAEPERKKKRETEHPEEAQPFAVLAPQSKSIDILEADDRFASQIAAATKAFSKKGVSDFMSTLTPGAQNAIYASSFAWGYENAARYLKGAMKQEEVKNAADTEERSKAVVESMQRQANADGVGKNVERSSFVFSYYNEDMKETQAQAVSSEAVSERQKHEEKEKERTQLQTLMPLSAREAAGITVAEGNMNAANLYLSESQAELERRKAEEKGERLARLVVVKPHEQRAKAAGEKDAVEVALERKEELAESYLEVEKRLSAAVDKLDALAKDDPASLQEIVDGLPLELRRKLSRKELSKRVLLRRQLVKWLAFARGGRRSVASLTLDRLKKIVSLSSLFR
jgi:hypothetical protein